MSGQVDHSVRRDERRVGSPRAVSWRVHSLVLIVACMVSISPVAAQEQRADHLRLAVGNHFTVSFEGPKEEDLAARALESLDQAYWRICGILNTYPNTPVPVVLYTSQEFRDITRAPPWAAGAFDGAIRVPMRGALEKTEELDRVMAHEFTHALIRTLATRGVPTWLNEGLAAALERDSTDWADEHLEKAGGFLPLARLGTSFGPFPADQAALAYATSAVAARRMLDAAGGVAVSNLLRDLGEGQPFDAAFLHRMQRPFAEFAASLGRVD